jgi:ribosome-binding protein aMBF1 (putative translation factor)
LVLRRQVQPAQAKSSLRPTDRVRARDVPARLEAARGVRNLERAGWSRTEIAQHVGTTPAAVTRWSNYGAEPKGRFALALRDLAGQHGKRR